MMSTIGDLFHSIKAWIDVLGRLGEPVEGENTKVTERRQEHMELVAKAKQEIEDMNAPTDLNASSTPPSRSPSCPTTRRMVSFPMLVTLGPSSSLRMVVSSESLPAAQALPTRPTSRTSPRTGGSSSRSRPSTPAASSTRSSSRYVASLTRSGLFLNGTFPLPFPLSPPLSHFFSFLVSSRLVSSHHTRSFPLFRRANSSLSGCHWRSGEK